MTDPASPPPPNADRRDAWRAAVLAYRTVRQRGELDHPARLAAIDAYLAVWPEDGPDEAERQVTRAICKRRRRPGRSQRCRCGAR